MKCIAKSKAHLGGRGLVDFFFFFLMYIYIWYINIHLSIFHRYGVSKLKIQSDYEITKKFEEIPFSSWKTINFCKYKMD